MKLLIFHTIIYFISSTIYAQNEVDYIASYNRHIDPTGKLDTIDLLSIQLKSDISYTLNFTITKQQNTIRKCNFYSDGTTKCVGSDDFQMPKIPEEDGGNAIKAKLNFIKIKENEILSFKLQSDSITVIERGMTPSHKYVYTFDSKTKDLLQMKRVNQVADKETYVSYTDFKSYQIIDGIIVPKKVTFLNNFSLASLEYLDVAFK
jgi:hypothetical protein